MRPKPSPLRRIAPSLVFAGCAVVSVPSTAAVRAVEAVQDGPDGRQWVVGRVAALPEDVPAPDPSWAPAVLLETLGRRPPPPGTRVVVLDAPIRHQRLLRLLEDSPAHRPVREVEVDDEGGFRFRTPDAGPWRLRVEAPGHVAMEMALPPVPHELHTGVVWLVPAVEDGVRAAATDGVGDDAWLASAASRSPTLAAQARLGPWRRAAIRAWLPAGGEVAVRRAVDEVLDVVVVGPAGLERLRLGDDGNRAPDPSGYESPPRTITVQAGRGEGLTAAGTTAATAAVVVVDGRVVAALPTDGRLSVAAAAGSRLEIVGADGSWGRHRFTEDEIAAGEPVRVVLHRPVAVPVDAREAGSGRRLEGWLARPPVAGREQGEAGPETGRATAHVVLGTETLRWEGGPPTFGLELFAPGRMPSHLEVRDQVGVEALGVEALRVEALRVEFVRQALIEGQVVDRDGPLAGVDVVAVAAESGATTWGRSGEDGLFRLQQVEPGRRLGVFALHPDFPVASVGVDAMAAGERRQDVRLELARPLDATGWVLDSAGEPVAGALVELFGGPRTVRAGLALAGSGQEVPEQAPAATTGVDGAFRFADLEEGTYGVSVGAEGLASTFAPGIEISPSAAFRDRGRLLFEIGTFQLVEERRLLVRITDPSGEPVPEASVQWSSALLPRVAALRFASRRPGITNPLQPPFRSTRTDGRGEAVLTGIEAESTVSLVVEAPGFVRHDIDELVVDWAAADAPPTEVVLQPAALIAGRVTDPDGRLLADVHVAIHSRAPGTELPIRTYQRTDAEGGFLFGGLPPGPLRLTANAPGQAAIDPVDLELALGERREGVELRAPRGSDLAGRVSSRRVDVEGLTVRCGGALARTGADGSFRLEAVRRGPQVLEVLSDAGRWARDVVVDASDGWIDVDLDGAAGAAAEASWNVSGRVIADGDLGGWLLRLRGGDGVRRPVLMEPDGSFAVAQVGAGQWVLSAEQPVTGGSASVRFEVSDRDVVGLELRLPADRSDGELALSVAGLDEREDERLHRYGLLPVRLSGVNVVATTARWRQGAFRVGGLEAGRWTVEASAADGLYEASAAVDVFEGETSDVVLDFRRSGRERVTGSLHIDGRPSPGWIVAADPSQEERGGGLFEGEVVSVRANALGQFELSMMPGPLVLLVSAGSAMGSFRAEAVPGVPLELDLRLARVRGVVTDAAGAAVSGARLRLGRLGSEAGYRSRAESAADGSFVIETLTLGEPLLLTVAGRQEGALLWSAEVAGSGDSEILVALPP